MAKDKSCPTVSTHVQIYQICPKKTRHERGGEEEHRHQGNCFHRRPVLPRLMCDTVTSDAITIRKEIVCLEEHRVSLVCGFSVTFLPGLSGSPLFVTVSRFAFHDQGRNFSDNGTHPTSFRVHNRQFGGTLRST